MIGLSELMKGNKVSKKAFIFCILLSIKKHLNLMRFRKKDVGLATPFPILSLFIHTHKYVSATVSIMKVNKDQAFKFKNKKT